MVSCRSDCEKEVGDMRFTVDLIRLNNLVQLDELGLPKINEITRSLNDAKYFTVPDLKDGFWRAPLRKTDREKIAFVDTQNKFINLRECHRAIKIARRPSNMECISF